MNEKAPTAKSKIAQEYPERAPAGWAEAQKTLAYSSGLSLLLVDGYQPPAIVLANNNSICSSLQSSPQHVKLCDPYCGQAHDLAMRAGTTAQYKCHAGLHCFTTPVQIGTEELVTIGGRAFVKRSDYDALVERFCSGDLKDLLSGKVFENVIFADERRIEQLAGRVKRAAQDFNVGPAMAAKEPTTSVKSEHSDAALENEIKQLRSEIAYRSRLAESLQHFLERISSADPAKTYNSILHNSKDLLQSERASLLVFDEVSNELTLKAAAGFSANASELSSMRLGEGVAGSVLERGRPLLVQSLELAGIKPAPADRVYKTTSFISYPITIAGRKIGILNVTDKSGGGIFDEIDLNLLEIIGPQVAIALDRAEWQERATEFQLMSITDPLTSLPNRRYLEERLSEELNRSKRYDYPMSFLMIDIDDFKSYNDINGHQAGDLALQITAHCLKASLRSADVAARYGGEEFCILLPQTPVQEAIVIAERMRQRVASTHYPHGKTQPFGSVTVSIGVSAFAKYIDTMDRVIGAADRALYNAKNQGKNQIDIYQEDLGSAGRTAAGSTTGPLK